MSEELKNQLIQLLLLKPIIIIQIKKLKVNLKNLHKKNGA